MEFGVPAQPQQDGAWVHAEYGAGNYGGTALIGDAGVHNLRKRDPEQFRVLYDELDRLVAERVWNRENSAGHRLEARVVQRSAPAYVYPDGTVIGPKQYVDGPHLVDNITRKKGLPALGPRHRLGRSFKPGQGCDWILQGVLSEARQAAAVR